MKCIKLMLLVFIMFFAINVKASSIDYKLRIDSNKRFYETIIYSIENDSQNDYLKSIITKPVYFDKKLTTPYVKSIKKGRKSTIIVLRYNYDSSNVQSSRLLNDCFIDTSYNDDGYALSLDAIPSNNCLNHADNISISIITKMNIINSNANFVNNNTQVWKQLNKDSFVNIEIGEINPNLNVNPPVSSEDYEVYNDTNIASDVKPKNNSYLLIAGIIVVALIVLITVYLIIIKKKKKMAENDFYNY